MSIVEINCETGEEVLREATKAEKDEAKARVIRLAEIEAEAEAKAAAKQAIADRLGLTADELKLLLG